MALQMMMEPVSYEQWKRDVPSSIRNDTLWKVEAYRLALFLGDIYWRDTSALTGDRRARSLADPLYRSVGSIRASRAEGYSRGTDRDRARFYEIYAGICSRKSGLVLQRTPCARRRGHNASHL